MLSKDIILLQLEESRRRSILVWDTIPETFLHWRPYDNAMSLLEMVRHILDCDEWYRQTILQRDSTHLDYNLIFGNRPLNAVSQELENNNIHRDAFLQLIYSLSEEELDSLIIRRKKGLTPLRRFLSEISYHEAYHAGQLRLCLRQLQVPSADIWE